MGFDGTEKTPWPGKVHRGQVQPHVWMKGFVSNDVGSDKWEKAMVEIEGSLIGVETLGNPIGRSEYAHGITIQCILETKE